MTDPATIDMHQALKMSKELLPPSLVELPALEDRPAAPCLIRAITADEIDALHALHLRIVESLPDARVLYRHDRDFFEHAVRGPGATLGAWIGGRLIAYGSIGLHGAAPDAVGRSLGLGDEELRVTAQLDGSGVDPAHRGRGLHRVLNRIRVDAARGLGCRGVLGVVSLFNPASLRSVMRFDYRVVALYHDADGANLLTQLRLDRPADPCPGLRREVEMTDADGHADALAEGLIGFDLRREDDNTIVLYG